MKTLSGSAAGGIACRPCCFREDTAPKPSKLEVLSDVIERLAAALDQVTTERDAALEAICSRCMTTPCTGAECEWWRGGTGGKK